MFVRQKPDNNELCRGAILHFKLRKDQLPEHPDKVWSGTIHKILIDIDDRSQQRYYLVTLTDPGYDETDLVYPEQVVKPPLPD